MSRPKKSSYSAPETDNFVCYEMGDSWLNCLMQGDKVFIDSCNISGDIGLSPNQARYFANKILLMLMEREV
jgi:hypothetical protein